MKKTILLGILLLLFPGILPSRGAPMDLYSRAHKWEIYGLGLYDNVNPGNVNVDVYGAGIGVGYNFIDQLGAYLEFAVGGANAAVDSGSGSSTVYAGNIGLDYNILKKQLTPFVTVGLGYTRFSSGGNYRGYAGPYAGLGLRWDFNDKWFAKAEYRLSYMITMLDISGDDDMRGNGIFLSAGFKF